MSEFETIFTGKSGITHPGGTLYSTYHNNPVRSRPYAIPYSCKETLKEDVEEMLDMGIIERTDSPYTSPVVVVQKCDGTNRVKLIIGSAVYLTQSHSCGG